VPARLQPGVNVPLRERNELLLSAGYAPAYSTRRLDDPELRAIVEAVEAVLRGHMPFPAVAVDRGGELFSANPAFWWLTGGVAPELLEPPVSVARMLLHPRGMAPRVLNLDVWARHVLNALRREAARNPSAALSELMTELEGYVPQAPRATADYVGFAVPLHLRHGDAELRLITTLTHFGTAVDVAVSELRLEAFLPADEATAAALTAATGRAT
jgi:hypothetical protein